MTIHHLGVLPSKGILVVIWIHLVWVNDLASHLIIGQLIVLLHQDDVVQSPLPFLNVVLSPLDLFLDLILVDLRLFLHRLLLSILDFAWDIIVFLHFFGNQGLESTRSL